MAFALLGPEIAGGEQPAEAAIGGAVGHPGGDIGRAVAEDEAAADGIARAGLSCREMAAHDAGQGVAVGDGKAGEAEHGGGGGELLRVRSAAQERKIRGGEELGVLRPTARRAHPLAA